DIVKYHNKTITRYLTGKNVSMEYGVGQFTNYLEGSSSVKDLPTLFELIYTFFTDINPNAAVYSNAVARLIPQLESAEKSPEFIFNTHKDAAVYKNNPLNMSVTADVLKSADYSRMIELYKESIANPADYTLIFTGNVNIDALKPLLEQYIASLATQKTTELVMLTPVDTADGQVIDNFTTVMTVPGDWLYGLYSGKNIDNSIHNQVKISLVGNILGILYTEIIREKEGGVYSPVVYSTYDINNGKWNVVYFLQTNEEQAPRILTLADELFVDLLKDGATQEQFNRVKGAQLSQYENSIRTNGYWHNNIRLYELFGKDLITEHRSAIENLTLDDFNDFMRTLYDGKNRIQINMHGVTTNK
ncbi:MAG: insulinase family protein, partial [Muribaculaceae bacterium]|nr:insulinase family protein [Muribaculaceae bacterium]